MVPSKDSVGARNGSFLVLNLESNTIQISNNSVFPELPQVVPPPVRVDKFPDVDAAGSTDVIFCPTEEAPLGSRNLESNTIQLHNNSGFPEIPQAVPPPVSVEKIPDVDAIGSTDVISSATKEGHSGSRNRKRVSKQTDSDCVAEKMKIRKSSRLISVGSSRKNPKIVGPPDYMVKLLKYSGWKVELSPSSGSHVYISPSCQTYWSLEKVYEAFLRGASRHNSTYNYRMPTMITYPQSGVAAKDKEKKGKAAKMSSSVVENMESNKPCEEPVLKDITTSQQVNSVVPSSKHILKTISIDNGKCLEVEFNKMALTGNPTRENDLDTSQVTASFITKDKREHMTSSLAENVNCIAEKHSEMGNSSLTNVSSIEIKWTGSWQRSNRKPLARCDRGKGKQVPVDDGSDTQLQAEFDDGHAKTMENCSSSGKDLTIEPPVSDYHFLPFPVKKASANSLNPDGKQKNTSNEAKKASTNSLNPDGKQKNTSHEAKKASTNSLNPDGKQKNISNEGCDLTVWKHNSTLTKICMLSWLIASGTLNENQRIYYVTKNTTNKFYSGLVTRKGIFCDCCNKVISLLKFQAHADSNLICPWENIYLQSGKTLMVCISEAWEKVKGEKRIGFQMTEIDGPDSSDDTCAICANGVNLINCGGCPSTFHQECLRLKALPKGIWYCAYCRCKFCLKTDHGTLSKCHQCGYKYHRKCVNVLSYPFCGRSCKQISALLSVIVGISHPIEGGFTWTLLKRANDDEGSCSRERISFIMECNAKLSMAFAVMEECFTPLIDQRTGLDMMCQAIYNCGSNVNRLNYEGFYTLILEKDDEIISAATLRFHGTNLAEMPFIGTRPVFWGQGMCRRLLKAVEEMLYSLFVEKLVIPAIPSLLEMWMTSFSFKHLESSHQEEIRNLLIVNFPCATLLQKSICNNTDTTRSKVQEDAAPVDNSLDRSRERQEISVLPGSYAEWRRHKDSSTKPCR